MVMEFPRIINVIYLDASWKSQCQRNISSKTSMSYPVGIRQNGLQYVMEVCLWENRSTFQIWIFFLFFFFLLLEML